MYSPQTKLQIPSDYEFPYEPYAIQQDLMESLYGILENKQIGIFESPTGTGKSLTLTCAALKWLLDHEVLVKQDLQKRIESLGHEIRKLEVNDNRTTDWIESQFETGKKRDEVGNLKKAESLMEEFEKKMQTIRERKAQEKKRSNRTVFGMDDGRIFELEKLVEEDLELDSYEDEQKVDADDKENTFKNTKIFFCSRTHAQLSQVVKEIKRTEYGKKVRCVSLASRQNLCIHSEVKRIPSSALINERCLDMQRSHSIATSSDSDGRCSKKSRVKHSHCPYKNQAAVESLSDSTLADILDVEDLVTAGEALKSCPYYATRASAQDAQLIMLPYQLLLHKRTRMQSGISLKNNIVIIDEAHNLLDTISSIYSSEINLYQLSTALAQMTAYKLKYCARFSTQNLLKINQMIFVTKRLIKMLSSEETQESRMLRTHELMAEGEFFNINLFQILEFCEQTRFAQKLQGFAKKMNAEPAPSENKEPKSAAVELLKKLEEEHRNKKSAKGKKQMELVPVNEEAKKAKKEAGPSVIRPLLAFWESLTECPDDGGVVITKNSDPLLATMKFILLNPGGHFEDIIKETRSIIIAGGTMRPTEELTNLLFKSCPERVQLKFYDHVVSSEAVSPFIVQKGPTGKRFLFNFSQRNNYEMLSELGMTLQNICNVVPAGVVCFFPSYDYLDFAYNHFIKEQFNVRISQKKHIFREPRGGGHLVEKLLADYAAATKDPERNGAILFSVVGGKLSEGLNFADDLGRCVIVVGMPYPNKNSPELQERMKYLEATLGVGAGSEYYENLCMKSVNQCIGRSVRHINDYASVLLIDERYANEKVRKKLPQWISRGLKVSPAFGMVQGATAKFFRQKQKS